MNIIVERSVQAQKMSCRKRVVVSSFLLLGGLFWFRLDHPQAFYAYLVSGWAASHHLDPYAVYPGVGSSAIVYRGTPHEIPDINMNPPCMLPLFQVLAHFGLKGFGLVWTLISLSCFAVSVGLIVSNTEHLRGWKLAWLCLCAAAFDTALSGQIYFLLTLLAAIGIVNLERRREIAAAVAIGLLVSIKPTFAFWPLFSGVGGRWRLTLQSLTVTALVWLAAWAAYGSSVYGSWFRALRNDGHWMEPTDIAIAAWIARAGHQRLGLTVAAFCVMMLALAIYRVRPSTMVVAGLGLSAGVLFAPLGWAAYAIVVAPALVATVWGPLAKAGAALLAIPALAIVILVPTLNAAFLVAGTVYTVGMVLVLAHFIAAAGLPGEEIPTSRATVGRL